MEFKRSLDSHTLSPDMAKTPLCMNQYQFMFSTRIPGEMKDTTKISTGDYFMVMRNNHFYTLSTTLANNKVPYIQIT